MEDRDHAIQVQVAFKEASRMAASMGLNLTDPNHQAVFEEMFSYLSESLFKGIGVSNVVQAFPGTTVVQQPYQQPQAQWQQPQNQGYGGQQAYGPPPPRVKGQSNGAFPDWALQAFAEKGVTEVYDNRHMLPNKPRLPWFKSTTGGNEAPAFWPPDS